MDNSLPVVYLSVLVGLLGFAVISVFRQILKTRKMEGNLSRLKNKLSKEKGTAQEYYELGSIYSEKKLFAQAIALFQKGIKAAEEEEEENIFLIYNALGFAYFSQEQYDLAMRQYKEALKYNPQYVAALNNLGHTYEKKKLNAQALEAYEQALKIEPNNATAKRRAESLRRRVVTA
ncbi:MAG: tetratricopeptide repeat protein [Nostocaceae cyanobacterium]|nr:tetratricopeptide repeat protein [Nostocaceae cyanobacterium]